VPRNRKRAKERRARRSRESAVARQGIASARAEGTPTPIEHAAPDAELADAQLALGRPELADEPFEGEGELELELEAEAQVEDGEVEEPAAAVAAVAQPRVGVATRLVGFLQGSWRELQRVQWPDRRQVVQATGVVIGFVIVAGVFLGVADTVASKLMTFILK
jgi:preprotein translocase SecE subunit